MAVIHIKTKTLTDWLGSLPKPRLRIGQYAVPWGIAYLAVFEDAICSLTFAAQASSKRTEPLAPAEPDPTQLLQLIAYRPFVVERLKAVDYTFDTAGLEPYWEAVWEYWLSPLEARQSLSVLLLGTPFQQAVWKGLLEVGRGTTRSYQAFAERIGYPKAVRAVATAIGANPIALLVPCHRIVPLAGGIGKYHWGATIKESLLFKEGALSSSLSIG